MSTRNYTAPSGDVVASMTRLDSGIHEKMVSATSLLRVSMNAAVNEACEMWLASPEVQSRLTSSYEDTIKALSGAPTNSPGDSSHD